MGDYHYEVGRCEELAMLDSSADYEVDYTFIGYRAEGGMFVLITASGCSCWDGDCEVEEFESLDEMKESLMTEDGKWRPSLTKVGPLIAEAKEKWFGIQAKEWGPTLLD